MQRRSFNTGKKKIIVQRVVSFVSQAYFAAHVRDRSCRRRFLGYFKLTRESAMMLRQLTRLTSH